MEPLRIFIGYDSREPVAYHVLAHSILRRTTMPVTIAPLALHQLGALYRRARGPTEATEFSMTRFLVPHLCGYEGHAVFMDSDMLCRVDLTELWVELLRQPDKAVRVCQHDYTPATAIKMDGKAQTTYPRKNWSSLMLFDNARCRALSPEYVSQASGLALHRFLWTTDAELGALPLEWNWLVGEYPANPRAKILHYTLGGPWFPETADCDHAPEWMNELQDLVGEATREQQAQLQYLGRQLMGLEPKRPPAPIAGARPDQDPVPRFRA